MNIIDAHCDLLSRMQLDDGISFRKSQENVDVNLDRLREAGVAIQFFALYLSEALDRPGFRDLLGMVDIFRRKVANGPDVIHLLTREDVDIAINRRQLGAILSLEGVDGLDGNLTYLRTLYALGVRFVGITWNPANWAADGVGEPRGGGFTTAGKELIRECNRLGIVMDVSHLAEAGFWQLAELSASSFIASHSNAKAVCPHRRNLTDEQIRAVIGRQGMIGLTFVPWFVKEKDAAISDILAHIDHIGSLGGDAVIGFGSDFDGFEPKLPGLEHPGHYLNLVEALQKHYSPRQVENYLSGNWRRFLQVALPRKERRSYA